MYNFLKKLINFFYREYKINLSGFHDILTNISFFFISIFIFIFSIGPEKETLSLLSVGIVWSLILLSLTLSLRKFYQDDFDNGNLLILHLNGFSFELICILKTISHFIYVQIPFLISIPIASILLNISFDKIYYLLISFLFGSLILLTTIPLLRRRSTKISRSEFISKFSFLNILTGMPIPILTKSLLLGKAHAYPLSADRFISKNLSQDGIYDYFLNLHWYRTPKAHKKS